MSRSNLLDGIVALAALPVLAVAVPVSSPDTEVINLAQGVIDAETVCHAADDIPTLTPEEQRATEPVQYCLMHGTSEMAEALAVLPVATLAGALAKAGGGKVRHRRRDRGQGLRGLPSLCLLGGLGAGRGR